MIWISVYRTPPIPSLLNPDPGRLRVVLLPKSLLRRGWLQPSSTTIPHPPSNRTADERGRSSLPTTGIPIVAGASRTGSARTEPVTAVALSIVTGTSLLASCSESKSHEYGEQECSPYSEGSDGLGHERSRMAEAAASGAPAPFVVENLS